jgi:hypothetical protein
MTGPASHTVKVSPVAARLIRDAAKEEKLRGVRGEISLSPDDYFTLLYFCCGSVDAEVKGSAVKALRALSVETIAGYLQSDDPHPRIVDLFARARFGEPEIAGILAGHSVILPETLRFLQEKGAVPVAEPLPEEQAAGLEDPAAGDDAPEQEEERDEEQVAEEENEEFKSKYQLAQTLGVSEKIKMALTGDKEWRSILIKDANKLVNGAVIKNPRISDGEVLALAKSTIQNDEIIRVICANKEWMKIYPIKKAMVENHKTPLPKALRLLAQLNDKDVGSISKSKNVSTVISSNARKILMTRKKH